MKGSAARTLQGWSRIANLRLQVLVLALGERADRETWALNWVVGLEAMVAVALLDAVVTSVAM